MSVRIRKKLFLQSLLFAFLQYKIGNFDSSFLNTIKKKRLLKYVFQLLSMITYNSALLNYN